MATKILILSLACFSGTIIGFYFAKRLKDRANYYASLSELINFISSEVSFRRNAIANIMNSFLSTNHSPLGKNINEYVASLESGNLVLSQGVLKKTELQEVHLFFSGLGSLDSFTQINELNLQSIKFNDKKVITQNNYKQHYSMYIKLGFFAGLALGIILL